MAILAIYYLLLTLSLFCIADRRLAIVMALTLSFAISALRFNAGFDYFSYMTIIEERNFVRLEPLNRFIMEIANTTTIYFYYYATAATTFLFLGLAILKGVKQYRISRLSVLAFIAFPVGFIESFGMIRQFCAAMVLLYAFMSRDNWKVWVPLCVLAPLFHFSTIVWVPVVVAFPWLSFRWSKPVYVLVLAVSPFLGELIRLIAQGLNFYGHYFDSKVTDFGQKIGLLFAFLAVVMISKISRFDDLRRHFNVFFAGVCLYLALAPYGANIARGAWYGLLLYPILIGALLRYAPWEKVAAAGLLTALFYSHFYFDQSNPNWQPISNYQFSILVGEDERLEWIDKWKRRFNE